MECLNILHLISQTIYMMKYLLFLPLLGASLCLNAQTPVVTTADLQSVTVYSRGVEMNHAARARLSAGSTEVVINNVANALDERSIQIGSSAGLTIMSVSFATNYLKEEDKSPAYLQVEAQLKAGQNLLGHIRNRKQSEESTLALLDENRKIGGSETGVTVAELVKMADFYKSRQLELRNNLITIAEEEAEQQKKVARLSKQLQELANDRSGTSGQLVLQVMAAQAGEQDFHISYISPNAGWTAFYDLRAERINDPLKILYKANVVQSTGIDWKKVKLTLSTGNPSQSGTAPVLSAWFLRYAQRDMQQKQASIRYQNRLQSMEARPAAELSEIVTGAAPGIQVSDMGEYLSQSENQLSATFDISLPYDIATNGRPHSVSLKEYSLPAQYKYYAVPRLEQDAFLMAEIVDYEQLNLMPGEANVIFENMYVGKSFIDPGATTDTLNLSMGRDKKITVKREQVVEETGSRFIGGSKKQTFTYEIRIRNGKKEKISLLLKDQYPIATDKDMEVELLQSDGADINKETGVLTWKLAIAPGETKKIRISYSVKYPKDKLIGNL